MCSPAAIGNLAAIQHGKQQQSLDSRITCTQEKPIPSNSSPYTLRLKQDRPTLGLLIPHTPRERSCPEMSVAPAAVHNS